MAEKLSPGPRARATGTASVVLRPARRTDIDSIVSIERSSFGDPWSPASFRSLIDNPHVFFAVATDDEAVLGYVVAWFVVDEAEVANLAVVPPSRKRRIGAMLLDAALDAARRRRIGSVFLEVRDSNAGARALYASRGFVEIGRRRGYYRKPVEDAVVMRRTLTDPPQ
ncbi:MAG TPA: ribosomal protein S18-alanine N-acetyltransferase [Gemmatimonadaceae bacterium]|nr:ribosomal protein S18-alanine N-acetyltransferase [Gemmatimonadaceae bacterium]